MWNHNWTDATTSQQLATTLTDADNNLTHNTVNPALGLVCIRQVVVPCASANHCFMITSFQEWLDSNLAAQLASWLSASSILVSSQRAQRARQGSDSSLTAAATHDNTSHVDNLRMQYQTRKQLT